MKSKLSVAIATFNEEQNIGRCLESVKDIADEIVIVDGTSQDQTVTIAKSFGVVVNTKVYVVPNQANFHINKQMSFGKCHGDWILYLDADEEVSNKLALEIMKVITMNQKKLVEYQSKLKNKKLFLRHQKLVEQRDGPIGDDSADYVAFFFPRLNFFLGKFIKYGGVYPDGVIRLFKRGKAYLPAKDVHEQMVVKGRVGWLQNDLLHYDSPTFARYIARNTRYTKLLAGELKAQKVGKGPVQWLNFLLIKPVWWFLKTQIRNKGILDGYQGITFSFFSALRFPRAYLMYLQGHNGK